jgi:hypothetical protein
MSQPGRGLCHRKAGCAVGDSRRLSGLATVKWVDRFRSVHRRGEWIRVLRLEAGAALLKAPWTP